MAKLGSFDCSEFKNMAKGMKKALDNRVIERWIREFLLEMAFRAHRKIVKRTPVGDPDNWKNTYYEVKKITRGKNKGKEKTDKKTLIVGFETAEGKKVSFAAKSNYVGGHLRRSWRVGKVERHGDSYVVEIFNNVEYASYVEHGHRTRNHKGWVEGKFMATISMNEIERELPRFIEKKQIELLNQMLNGR